MQVPAFQTEAIRVLSRLVTFAGLVVRRLWSKRGILVGSALGAVLVTSLLVIVPLYEDSIASIDLLFTVRNAPDDDVDIAAFHSTTSYVPEESEVRHGAVEAAAPIIDPWYDSSGARILTREFIFIPLNIDYVGAALAWQEAYDAAVAAAAQAEDPESVVIPSTPWPAPPVEATQSRIVTADDISSRIEVVGGEFTPGPDPARLRIAIGEDLSRLTGLQPGDETIIRPFVGGPDKFALAEVSAVVRAADPAAQFWGVTDPSRLIYVEPTVLDRWLTLNPAPDDDPWRRQTLGFTDLDVSQRWFFTLDRDELGLEDVEVVQNAINSFRAEIARADGISTVTNLGFILGRFTTRSEVFSGPILAMLALVVGGALYFLIYTASLTLEREAPELALLRTRGASAWQTVGIHLAQSAVVAVLAALVAPVVAGSMVGLAGRLPPLSALTGGEPLSVEVSDSLRFFVLTGAILTFVTMGLAVLPIARRTVLELRSLAARPTRVSIWQKYYVDVFLVVIAVVFLFQLVQTGFVVFEEGEAKLNIQAVFAPALFLLAGALLLLRVMPWLLRLIGWLMTRAPGMRLSLAGWHLGRNPIPYGRLALLVWITTGFGAFALTYGLTLEGSFDDRAAFAAGSDVRLVGDKVGYTPVPDSIEAAAVFRSTGAPRLSSRRAELIAVRPGDFAQVVAWRDDYGDGADPAAVFGALRPDGPPDVGIDLPAGAEALTVEGIVIPRSWADQAARGGTLPDQTVRLMIRVFDARSKPWTLAADVDFSTTRWSRAEINFGAASARDPDAEGPIESPMSIVAAWIEGGDRTSNTALPATSLLLDDWQLRVDGTHRPLSLDALAPTDDMQVRHDQRGDLAAGAYFAAIPEGEQRPTPAEIAASPLYRSGEVDLWVVPTRSRLTAVPHLAKPPEPLNVLLDREAAAIAGLEVGSTATFGVGESIMPGTLVGLVEQVPTMLDRRRNGVMVVDLDAVGHWLNATPTWSLHSPVERPDAPDELWAKAQDPDAVARQLTAAFGDEPDAVITARGQAAEFSSRPVQVGLVAILFIGAFVGVVLTVAGVTGYVLLAVSRRAREMGVLRALGFDRSGVAATFAVEQLVVLGLGAVVGVAAGIGLMWLMIPFLQLGERAEDIVPSVLVRAEGSTLGIYVAVVGLLLIVSVVWATRRVSVRRMSEVLREVER